MQVDHIKIQGKLEQIGNLMFCPNVTDLSEIKNSGHILTFMLGWKQCRRQSVTHQAMKEAG